LDWRLLGVDGGGGYRLNWLMVSQIVG